MTRAVWDTLLAEARAAHKGALDAFCPFPTDLKDQPLDRFRVTAADYFEGDKTLTELTSFGQAFLDASPHAKWRETWKDSQIGGAFLDRFGCYCLIGDGGAFSSRQMSAYVVYMPSGLHYPWHQHPAEEIYYVLSGQAEFERHGAKPEILGPGDHVVHGSNQPHATTTHDQPLLAYVLWKGDLGTKPIWTEAGLR